MGFLYNTMLEFFKQDDWEVTPVVDSPTVTSTLQGQNGRWLCIAQVSEEEETFLFYSVYPGEVPDEKLAHVATFITFANYDMLVGNFELSFADNDLRFRTSLNIKDVSQEQDNLLKLLHNLIYINVQTMDKYYPGIEAVINQDVAPDQAIEMVEDDENS